MFLFNKHDMATVKKHFFQVVHYLWDQVIRSGKNSNFVVILSLSTIVYYIVKEKELKTIQTCDVFIVGKASLVFFANCMCYAQFYQIVIMLLEIFPTAKIYLLH